MSKVLEIYNEIEKYLLLEWGDGGDLIIVENALKALEIIKEKAIDAQDVMISNTYSEFNKRRSLRGLVGIPKEEYDLLKEVLEDD